MTSFTKKHREGPKIRPLQDKPFVKGESSQEVKGHPYISCPPAACFQAQSVDLSQQFLLSMR